MANCVTRQFVAAVLTLARRAGLAVDDLDRYREPEWIEREAYWEMWRAIEARCNYQAWLEMGRLIERGNFGLFDYWVRNASTIGDGMLTLCRDLGLVYQGPALGVRVDADEATLYFVDALSPRPASEFAVSAFRQLLSEMCGPRWRPLSVRFQHPAPAERESYQRFFGCPVVFASSEVALDFPAEFLSAPVIAADQALRHVLKPVVEDELKRSASEARDDFLGRLRRTVETSLAEGKPTRDQIAKQLQMSGSTLQRRLKQQGVESFGAFVDDLREQLARHLLESSDISVAELADRLGFADASNFVRSFRRWTGTTPAAYRHKA